MQLRRALHACEDDARAGSEMRLLQSEMDRDELTETYLVYYLSTLAVAEAVVEGGDQLRRANGTLRMKPFVDALQWPCAPYVRRRQTLLETRLTSTLTVDDRHALGRRVDRRELVRDRTGLVVLRPA